MAQNGIPFSCRYNNVAIEFNGKPIYRPYPTGDVYEEPLDSKESWRFKEFKVKNEEGKEELVGIGWAVIRGSRLKKGKNLKDPVEATGVFKTEPIRGIQVRLYNVEVIPYNKVYSMFGVKIPHQPVFQIWGEIYLFNEEIMIDPKRENLVNEGLTKIVRGEIKKWIEETLKFTEDRRHEKTSWKKVLTNYDKVKSLIESAIQKLSEKTDIYVKEPDTVKNYLENWKRKNYKTLKENLNKAFKVMEKEFDNISSLNYVINILEILIKEAKERKDNFIPLVDNYINSIIERIKYRKERAKLKEEKRKEEEQERAIIKKDDKQQEPEKTETKVEDKQQKSEITETKVEDKQQKSEITETKVEDKKQKPEKVVTKKDDEKQDEEPESDDEIDDWEHFKEYVFSSYELSNLEEGLLKELIDIVDLYIENDEDKRNVVNRISILLNEQIEEFS